MENDKIVQPNEVMNGDEAAVFLKMPKSTLLKLCTEGQLPGVKVGRQWRFHRDALEKWSVARNSGNDVETPSESVDFSQSLTKAVARVDRNIKPVVEEFAGSVGGDDFETTGEVRELSDDDDFVGEVNELPPTKATKGGKKDSPSALDLMAQISEKTQGRRPGRPPKAKPAPVQEPQTRDKRSELIRETFRDRSADSDAVEISRPYTKPAAGSLPAMAPSRKNSHQSSLFKMLAYTVLALGLLGLAGMGIKSLLIPISLLDSVTPPAASTLPKLPPLPEFPLVYKHNDPDEITPESVVPSDKANRPIQAVAAPVVQPTPVAQASPVVAAATPIPAPTAAAPVPPATLPVAATATTAPANAQLAAQPAPEVAAQSSVIAPPAVDKGLEAINRIRPGLDQLPGCIVYSSKNEIRIMFQEGIFPDGGLKIGKTGRSQLSQVADYLAKNAPDFWLIIEGQTNTQPTRSSDNYTLGLSRAVAATEVVRTSAKFPTERLMASSAGGSQPPFAVSIPGAEKKNRTVLFRLVPKAGDMPASQQ